GHHRGLVARVAAGPRARLDLDEVAVARGVEQAIQVDVELDAAVGQQPPAAILFHDALVRRPEVRAIDPRGVRRRRVIARARQQDAAEAIFLGPPGQRQPRARAGHVAGLVEELVLAVAQPALLGIVERPVGVELVIVAGAHHRDAIAVDDREHLTGGRHAGLYLDLEALLLDGAADG